jgi:hypothetical protein
MLSRIVAILLAPYMLHFSGGGGGGQQSTTTTQVNYSPEEQADRSKIRDEAARIYGTTSGSVPAYPGAGVAPLSPESQAAQQYIMSAAGGPLQRMSTDIANATQFGMSDIINGKDPTLDAAIDASVRPIYQAYTDPGGYFSQLRTEMGNNNTVGGSRDQIGRAVLGGRFAQAAGDTAAKVANQSRSDTLSTFARTLAFAPQAMSAALQPGVAMSAVGEQNQAQKQAEMDFASQQGYWDINAPWQQLANYANLVYGGSTAGTTSTSNIPQARSNPITGALSGAMMGSAIMPGIGTGVGALLGLLGGM